MLTDTPVMRPGLKNQETTGEEVSNHDLRDVLGAKSWGVIIYAYSFCSAYFAVLVVEVGRARSIEF